MSSKSQESYVHILQYIESNLFKMNCISFQTDFELASRNALKIIYPDATLFTCWFHFKQASIRKSKKIPGFFNFLKINKDAKRIFDKFLSLPLLNSNDISTAFEVLKVESSSEKFIKNGINQFEKFIDYYETQWLKKVKY